MNKNISFRFVVENKNVFIYALAGEKEVGHAWFSYNHKEGRAWLYYVGVQKGYSRQGIGSVLLKLCEQKASKMGAYNLQGWFYPNEYITPEALKKFYVKNGYEMYWDEHLMVAKRLERKSYQETEEILSELA